MTIEKILVVDHVEDRREHLVKLLENRFISVVQTASSEECLELLDKEFFRVVLSETELPKKSGLHLLKEIKVRSSHTEVVLLATNASSFSLLQALRHGVFDFILRPIDSGEILFSTVGRAIAQSKFQQERDNQLSELKRRNHMLDHELRRMKSLTEHLNRMVQSDRVEEIFSLMLEAAVKELGAENGMICLLPRDGKQLVLKVSQNIAVEVAGKFARQIPPGLIEVIARRAKAVLVPDQLPHGLAVLVDKQEQQDLLRLPGLISIPLRLNKRIAGVVLLTGHPPRVPFNEQDLRYLIQLVSHAQYLLEKVGQMRRLMQVGNVDPSPAVAVAR